MKTWHVGGTKFFNKLSSLKAAVFRAEAGDIIEIHKDIKEDTVRVDEAIIIKGNGHTIVNPARKYALICKAHVVLEDMSFEGPGSSGAVSIQAGGILRKIKTNILGPAPVLCRTVAVHSGQVSIENSEIMYLSVQAKDGNIPEITVNNSRITDYYGGGVCFQNTNSPMSVLFGKGEIRNSYVENTAFCGTYKVVDSVFGNFNRSLGSLYLKDCTLASHIVKKSYEGEPEHGPLKSRVNLPRPMALCIVIGRTVVENFSTRVEDPAHGFVLLDGALEIRNTRITSKRTAHLLDRGSASFVNVDDVGVYQVEEAACSVVNSRINTPGRALSAMERLDGLIGLSSVKRQLHTILNTISMNQKNPEKDFGFSHHMVFAGDPGTGKTTVARLAAQALYEIGAIPENKCTEVPASQMIKGYVGQTGEHVENILKNALGGVLFIDEAYELAIKDGQNTFNNDALAVLLRYMEDHRRDLVVIAAGYEKEMRDFIASNAGLARRFQWVSFEDYTPGEMVQILYRMMTSCKESFAGDARNLMLQFFTSLTAYYKSFPDAKGRFTNGGNGGLVRNVFQSMAFARNNRIAEDPASTQKFIRDDIQRAWEAEKAKADKLLIRN